MDKSCTECGNTFDFSKEEQKFYRDVSPSFNGKTYTIPDAILCPDCRIQKLLAWRNERSIYSSTCGLCGKSSISQYAPESAHTVYCHECFWGDSWNALDYGRDYDFEKPFAEQFAELFQQAPIVALINTQAENSEYCHRIYDGRNNYLCFISLFQPENLLYSYYTITCKDCTDISQSQYCELCYDLVDAERCYNCHYGNRIRNCKDCYFMEGCIGCNNCFGCKNLNQKSYCIFNEQKTKEEYEEFIREAKLSSHSNVERMREKVHEHFQKFPNREKMVINAENVTGANIFHCRESEGIYDLYESEHMRYCHQGEKSHHCTSCTGFGEIEFCFQSVTIGFSNNLHFCASSFNSSDLFYCYDCYANCSNCFGCIGLKKAQYCILNKQYTEEEYNALVPKIIEHMQSTGEWGNSLPVSLSPFAYNETVAQEYFPLTQQEIHTRGYRWRENTDDIPNVEKVIPASSLPNDIADIPDDILHWAIQCEKTNRPFKVIEQELKFYRTFNLPIPRLHPDERHMRRMILRNPRKLWERQCAKCQKDIQTTYAPERPKIVYCESCYLNELY